MTVTKSSADMAYTWLSGAPGARRVLCLVLALGLAGCETVGAVGSVGTGVAEVVPPSKETSVNIDSLSDVISQHPNDPEAYNTRGAAYARTGKFAEAIADFTKAIQLDPNNTAAYTNRALAYRQTKHGDLALADFNHALQSNPNHAPAYLGRANLLRAQGEYSQAMSDLDQAIRLNPEGQQGAQAFHARGLIHQRQGEHVLAITDFDNAIDRDPFAAAPYQARAQSLMAQGKFSAAIEDLNAALNVDTKNPEAWANLGLAYEKSNNAQKARESYARAKILDPNNQLAADGLSRIGS
jgi:tetratricopeptide (TPR) repeat protein